MTLIPGTAPVAPPPLNRRTRTINRRKGIVRYPKVGTLWRARYTWIERLVLDFSASWITFSRGGIVYQCRWESWWVWVLKTEAIVITPLRQKIEKYGPKPKSEAHEPGYQPF